MANSKSHHWTISRAAPQYRRKGNRDLYLRHKRTGAQAAIYITPDGEIAVSLPGGRFAATFATRREAFNHVLARALQAYEGSR